jgi:hypothetical protein
MMARLGRGPGRAKALKFIPQMGFFAQRWILFIRLVSCVYSVVYVRRIHVDTFHKPPGRLAQNQCELLPYNEAANRSHCYKSTRRAVVACRLSTSLLKITDCHTCNRQNFHSVGDFDVLMPALTSWKRGQNG